MATISFRRHDHRHALQGAADDPAERGCRAGDNVLPGEQVASVTAIWIWIGRLLCGEACGSEIENFPRRVIPNDCICPAFHEVDYGQTKYFVGAAVLRLPAAFEMGCACTSPLCDRDRGARYLRGDALGCVEEEASVRVCGLGSERDEWAEGSGNRSESVCSSDHGREADVG